MLIFTGRANQYSVLKLGEKMTKIQEFQFQILSTAEFIPKGLDL